MLEQVMAPGGTFSQKLVKLSLPVMYRCGRRLG
jgi:hypothetical protein